MIDRGEVIYTIRKLLRPIVRLMLGLGINARDFVEIGKMVYADVALREGDTQGGATTLSGAARITGLTRREVTRLRGVLENIPSDSGDSRPSIERVLEIWHTDPRFVTQDGVPRVLSRRESFAELLNEHCGDLSASTLIEEMQAHHLIRISSDEVTVQGRFLPTDTLVPSALERLEHLFESLGQATSSKMYPGPGRGSPCDK